MKNYLKRTTTFILALLMLLSVPLQAFAEVTQGAAPPKEEKKINYDKTPIRKGDYVNKVDKLPVVPAKPGEGVKSADYIKDPDKPKLYTVRSDFKVQRGDDEIVSYQPYEATVGDDKYKYKDIDGNEKVILTKEEKDKINKTLVLPVLDGYTSPTPQKKLEIKYDFVNDPNKTYKQKGDEKRAEHPFIYQPKESEIGVKHLFQDFNNLEKFGKKPGSDKDLITKQTGLTGTIIKVQPLPEEDRKGYVPESTNIMTQIPENNKDFIIEFRYKRAYFDVVYDTKGKHLNSNNVLEDETEYGTSIPTRRAFYEQRIPNLPKTEIPTKIGSDFLGWMPSVDLKGTINGTEKTFNKGEVIKDSSGNPILDLENTIRAKDGSGKLEVDPTTKKPVYKESGDNIELIMPGEKLTFISKWEPKPKADYAVQFWAEKADHADRASLSEKYEFIGARVYKDKDTGSIPNLDNEPVKDIVFPDLDKARLKKIWNGEKFYGDQYLLLNKFFVYNKNLTHDENKDPKKPTMTKAVSSTGKTVYNIYYDRQVYDLYFTKSNKLPAENTFYPSIYVPDGEGGAKLAGGPGNPYHYTARFNQLMRGWPNDAMQTKGFDEGKQSYGWGPNYGEPHWPTHLDTPPYRLNADEFLDMPNYDNWGGYVSQIDDGAGGTIHAKNYRTLSFGIKQNDGSMPHHMDFWMDGFQPGETIIRYDLYRSKADTNDPGYGHKYPRVQGFMPYGYTEGGNWPTIEEGSEENGRVTSDGIDALNEEREKITPLPDKEYMNMFGFSTTVGQMSFLPAFFNTTDDFGDPLEGVTPFKENGYLRFKYHRNKYSLRFNYDPSKTRGDSDFGETNSLKTFYEFPLIDLDPKIVARENKEIKEGTRKEKEKFKIDNPNNLIEMGLTDLVFKDSKDDNKLKVKRPDNISSDMEFKGWALDPAGTKLLWKNSKEIMPTHPLNLYAKWAEPDYQWKVTIDPDGGKMPILDNKKLATSEKTVKVGDVGQEEEKTFPVKGYKTEDPIQGDKQVFTVIHRQKLSDLINKGDPLKSIIPTKKGYEFMGWEIKRYKKDAKGDYTDELDEDYSKAYKEKYKFPEIYAFGNDVVSPIYLKAIWIKNDTIDIPAYHHFLDDKYNEPKEPMVQMLRDRRVGSYLAAVGSKQNQNRILVPKEEWEKLEKGTTSVTGSMSYSDFKKLNDDPENPRVNSYIQQIRIEPPKIKDEEETAKQGKDVYKDNPKAKNNAFHFYYRPFRKREYKVNYIDERFKGTADEKEGAIIDQETVINGKRHFDARNFRTIPGWKLVSAPQQQLIFDINEDTNEFYGINGTGKKEITFYYKDIRIVETKSKDDPVPDGYVRVTFKADKGGSFGKDAQNNEIKEIYYDVIKGLKSDYLPVPQLLKDGETKDDKKYYITPDVGKSFKEWTDAKLLNNDTIIEKAYTFTAKFDWSGLSAKASGIVMTEAFNDPNNKWTNKFAPTIEDLKKQLVWKEKDVEKQLPDGTEIKLYDEADTELKTDKQVYDLVKEKNAADKDEVVRTVNIKAKVTFKDSQDSQELTIPIKVYKNVYQALTGTDKPNYLSVAEKGELKDITGDYIKVTVAPTGDMNSKDNKVYYVNKNAWVVIPEVKPDGSSTFINWTADKDAQNDDGKVNGNFDFEKRHKFTEETVIKPVGAGDVVEQTDQNKKPPVPNSYVKVIVKTTDKATDDTKFEKTFWVNPTKEVTIPVTNPTGKTVAADATKPGTVGYTMNFFNWKSEETTPRTWKDKIVGKFENETTIIAKYSVEFEKIKDNEPTKGTVDTPQGKTPTSDEIKEKLTPPDGKTISNVKIVADPDVTKPGESKVKVIVEYTDGSSVGTNDNPVEVPVKVHEPIVLAKLDGTKPKEAMDNYVKVIFKAGEGGKVSGNLVYYVSPEVEVDMTDLAGKITKTPDVGYISGDWDTSETKKLKAKFIAKETEFTFNFTKTNDIVEKTSESVTKPDRYVTVRFLTNKNGTLTGSTTYYVNPNAKKTMKDITAPTITANDGYKVGSPKWKPDLAADTAYITEDKIFVANYDSLGKAEINYISMDTNMGTVSSPSESILENQNIVGSTATAKDGYKFVKWTDVTGKQVSTFAKFVPDKKESATYIAIFEKEETTADKVNKSYDLEGIDLGVFVGDMLGDTFWKDGVSKKIKDAKSLTDVEKAELEKALKDATVSDKSGRNSKHEVLSPSIGILEIKFKDGSTLSVEQKLYVYDNGSQVPKDSKQPTPKDKVEVTYMAGEGVEKFDKKFDEKTVMVKKGTLEKDLPNRPKANAKGGFKDPKWTASPAIDERNGIQEKTTLTASAVTDHDFEKTSFTVNKVWEGDVNDVPTMNFTLYRKVEGSNEAPGEVQGAEVKEITKETTTATWDKLAKTNSTGKAYIYSVKETFKDESSDVRNANWILGDMVTDANKNNTITNKLKTVPGTGDTPKEDVHRMGKLTITKKIDSKVIKPKMSRSMFRSATTPLAFTFKVTDPYGNVETFTLKAGESKELKNLLYGEYTVEETDAQGLTPFVNIGNGNETESKTGKVTLTKNSKEETVTFTNKNVKPQENPNIIEVEATKIWVNGPSKDHTAVDLKLYRQVDNGQKEEVTDVTPVKTRDANDANKFNYVWKDLSKINDQGKEYTYSVEEANVTYNKVTVNGNTYEVSKVGNTITNTYEVPQTEDNVIGKKVWSGVPDGITPPTVKLELWRKTSANDPGEKVEDAKDLINNQADFGKKYKTDANGLEYIYFVKEVDESGSPFKNDRYDSAVNNLTVTNTYKPPTIEYTVTYKAGSASASGSMDSVKVEKDSNYTVLANGFTNPGYNFKGWKVDNSLEIVGAGSIIKVTGNVTLTAQWEKITTPPRPGDPDNPDNPDKPNPDKPNPWNPDYPNPGYPGGPGYPSYPGGPIPRYPEIRYETIVKEKIVKVPVPVTDGYFKEVRYMQGFDGYFRPNDGLTRAEAAQILANALVEDGYKYNPNFKISYKDVGGAWYTRAVKIVTEAKVFTGYDDGNFKPQAKITRNEWIATLKRFQELGSASGNNMKLRDGHWAKAEIQAAFNEGWLKIYTDGLATYKGDEFIPRQEVAAVSNKAFKRIVDKTYIGKNNLSLVTYKDVNTSMWAYEDILCASNTFLDKKDRYIAHWVKEDKNQFNIDTSDFKIVQKNFQRNPR